MQANGSIWLYVLNNLHVHINTFKKDDSSDGLVLRFNSYACNDNVNKIIGKWWLSTNRNIEHIKTTLSR